MKSIYLLPLITTLLLGCGQQNQKNEGPLPEVQTIFNFSSVQVQLRVMAETDAEIRAKFNAAYADRNQNPEANVIFKELAKRMREQDISNHMALATIVEEHGWIGPNRFGKQASRDAWLITQHMVHDKGVFQRKMLSFMEPGVNVDSTQYALLTDRIAVTFDKSVQEYGTQGKCQKNGKWVASPIRDFSQLDERRLTIGFEPFAEYQSRMNTKCQPN